MHDAVGLQGQVLYIAIVPNRYCEIALVVTDEVLPHLHGPADGHEFGSRREWISYMTPSVYEYLCGIELSSIDVPVEDVPSPTIFRLPGTSFH